MSDFEVLETKVLGSPKKQFKPKQEKKQFENKVHSELVEKAIEETKPCTKTNLVKERVVKNNSADQRFSKKKIIFNMIIVRQNSYDAGLGAWIINHFQQKSELLSMYPNSVDCFFEKALDKGTLSNKRHIALIGLFPSKEVLIRLSEAVGSVSVFDFRSTDDILFDKKNGEKQPKNLFYHFVPKNFPKNIQKPIASVMVWVYVNGENALPEFIRYAQDADGFWFELPNSQAVSLYMQCHVWDFQRTKEKWKHFFEKCDKFYNDFESTKPEIFQIGSKLVYERNILIKHTIEYHSSRAVWNCNNKNYFIWLFESCHGVNCEIGNTLMKVPLYKSENVKSENVYPDFVMCWKYDWSNKECVFHLFSIDEKENVYEISKLMGNTISSNRNCSMFHLSAEIKLHDMFEFLSPDPTKFVKTYSEEFLKGK